MSLRSRGFTWLLAASLSFAGFMQSAQAGVIGTAELAAPAADGTEAGQAARARLSSSLDNAELVQALQQRGVSAEEARARVAALSDEEAAWMVQQIDAAPAGASEILGTLVFIFVLLLVTDILGLTKVYPFTRSVR
ncbi:PA2779 family protein [Ideonella sp.]|uniref:PA2779 family protein n=1 Tax=Ideonella sp. TaxID=1929293 RepID=UPI003BB75986